VSNPVLDASVLIAVARSERYEADILPHIDGAVMSAVNFAEVITRFLDIGINPSSVESKNAFSLLSAILPFTESQASLAGELRRLGKHVALGDRACMALAIELDADIYTADAEWTGFDLELRIHLIR
jgi:PIN domain nuclease of toxin-antitoxin system